MRGARGRRLRPHRAFDFRFCFEKRQFDHKPGLTHRPCPREFSITEKEIVMMRLRVAALANARKPGLRALVFSDAKTPTGNAANCKQAAAGDLGQMGLVTRADGIFFGKATGRRSERTKVAVVAEVNDDADRWLRSIIGGRPLAGSVTQAAEHFGNNYIFSIAKFPF